MPIYAYKCSACGFAKDALQKLSDPPLTVCPNCGESTFAKQLTAAGFQLKGSGWYVTDFRDGNKGGAAKESAAAGEGGSSTPAAPAPAPSAAPAPVPATAPAPSPSSGGSGSSGSSGSSSSSD